MLRAIREIQPRWVVGENVFGLVNWSGGLVFHEVQADLEAAGYEVWPYVLPACAVNAPHRRDRVWFVAHNFCNGGQKLGSGMGQTAGQDKRKIWDQVLNANYTNGKKGATPHPNNNGQHSSNSEHEINPSKGGEYALDDTKPVVTSDTIGIRTQRQQQQTGIISQFRQRREGAKKIIYDGGIGAWEKFPTQPPVCSGNDGLPSELDGITIPKHRKESLMAYGNAVVPQVVYQIFKAINDYETKFHEERIKLVS